MIFKVGGPAQGNWESWGRMLGVRDRGRLGAFSAFPGAGWFFSDRPTDPLLRMAKAFEGAGGMSQEALEAPQPFHPMDLETLQEREVKQWPKDTVILLVWD